MIRPALAIVLSLVLVPFVVFAESNTASTTATTNGIDSGRARAPSSPFPSSSSTNASDDDSKTIRHRDLTIDLGGGIRTDAELTLPVLANHSLPALLLIHGLGPADKDHFFPPQISDHSSKSQNTCLKGAL